MTVPTKPFSYDLVAEDYQGALMATAERIRSRQRSACNDILEIGRDLIATKTELEHGLFLGWIETEFKWSERTAQNYMRVAKEWGDVESATVADLPPKLLYDLSAKSNAGIKTEVIADLDKGKQVDVPAVKARINTAKAKKPTTPAPQPDEPDIEKIEAARKQYAAEFVAIVRKLPECDFNRLIELALLLPSTSWWVLQDMLYRGRP